VLDNDRLQDSVLLFSQVLSRCDAIASGRVLGPRILACGHGLSITGGHMDTKGSGIDSGPLSSGVADGVEGFRHAARLVYW